MNPFSLLNIQESYDIDAALLERNYLQAQKLTHPDHLVNASVFEKRIAIDQTARINEAYRLLKDPVARARYFLESAGLVKKGEETITDPELLAEIFDLQEKLAEDKDAVDVVDLRTTTEHELREAFNTGDLQKARKLTFKLGYLQKV